MKLDTDQLETIRYSMLSEPGDALAHLLFEQFGSSVSMKLTEPKALRQITDFLLEFHPEKLSNLPGLIERFEFRSSLVDLEATINKATRWGARPVFFSELPGLANRLSDLGDHAPYLVWVAGDPNALELDYAGVVGTRTPTPTGLNNTSKLVRMLNTPVVSGGAKGIDAASHRSALDAGLPTIAFMAGGIDRAYPLENWSLFHELVRSGGALVSELAPGTAPSRFRFLQRNRLIAATSSELYVVQAAYRSGSRNTANAARMLGREVYAVPGAWSDRACQGTNAMIQEGLAKAFHLDLRQRFDPEDSRRRVEDAIRNGARTNIEIAAESGLRLQVVEQVAQAIQLDGDPASAAQL